MDIKEIRELAGLTQASFAKKYHIPLGTLRHWEAGERKPPTYVLYLLERCERYETLLWIVKNAPDKE